MQNAYRILVRKLLPSSHLDNRQRRVKNIILQLAAFISHARENFVCGCEGVK
jgi:hypothetical protein